MSADQSRGALDGAAFDRSPLRRREFLRGSAGVLAGGAGALLLGACGSDAGTAGTAATVAAGKPPSTPTGTLRVANYEPMLTLDPSRTTGGDISVARNIYDSLVRYEPVTGEPVPSLATGWESSDDDREWIFTLRDDVVFHDGEPLDASAVRTSLEYWTGPGSTFAGLLPTYKEIDDSDPTQVRVVLDAPRSGMLSEQMFVKIASPKAIAKATRGEGINADPIGSGPFRFVERGRDGSIVLEAFDGYWGDGPYLERLELKQIDDLNARVAALLAGDVDMAPHLPPEQVRQLQQQGDRVQFQSADIWQVGYVMLRADIDPLKDPRVRRAINHAIDRETLAKTVLLDAVEPADSVYPKTLPGYAAQPDAYRYDPDLARRLLAEAGVEAGDVTVHLAALAKLPWYEAVVGMLNDFGFDVRARVFEVTVFTRELTKPNPTYIADVTAHGWITQNLVFGLMADISHSDDREVRSLLRQLNTCTVAERNGVVADLQRVYAEQAFYLPIYFDKETDAMRPGIGGYHPPLDGFGGYYGTTFLGDA